MLRHFALLLPVALLSGAPRPARSQEVPTITITGVKNGKVPVDVKTLRLGGTELNDEGLKELKALKQLTTLDLRGTRVTDAGLRELKELEKLESLDLHFNKVTGEGLKEV